MATRIIEFVSNDPTSIGAPIVPAVGFIKKQGALTLTTSPTQGAAFDTRTNLVCVQCDEASYVELGTSNSATTDSYRIQAGQEQFFSVPAGAGWKVSART
jgi:hypothetical protein